MNASPRVRIEAECSRRGRQAVVAGCVAMLGGDEPDPSLVFVLGGSPALRMLAGDTRADVGLWSRVWAIRGLLWALDAATADQPAVSAVTTALRDPAWRVREKAAQVVARHLLDVELDELVALRDADPVPRVRQAADRAIRRIAADPATPGGSPRPPGRRR